MWRQTKKYTTASPFSAKSAYYNIGTYQLNYSFIYLHTYPLTYLTVLIFTRVPTLAYPSAYLTMQILTRVPTLTYPPAYPMQVLTRVPSLTYPPAYLKMLMLPAFLLWPTHLHT